MQIVKHIPDLKKILEAERNLGHTIGLVPTMGALHQGHASLVSRCVAENDVCVVSDFVNPTQFNDQHDLLTYPRKPQEDAALLESLGCHLLFMPEVEDMYPEQDTRIFRFGALEQVMEGAFRPGHFNGVAQIVSKLFDAVMPGKAYFGEKDFQQLAIIRAMVAQLNLNVRIVPCPIVREADGLAMSSRNARLTPEQRKKSALISRCLFESRHFVSEKSVGETIDYVVKALSADALFRLDYFQIVDGNTLQAVSDWSGSSYIVGCIAVYCGEVRLIDNIVYKSCK